MIPGVLATVGERQKVRITEQARVIKKAIGARPCLRGSCELRDRQAASRREKAKDSLPQEPQSS